MKPPLLSDVHPKLNCILDALSLMAYMTTCTKYPIGLQQCIVGWNVQWDVHSIFSIVPHTKIFKGPVLWDL